ncbi:NAD(P)H-dependent oxidoreductase subunit E [Candidatus Woesearchaeota archaeon]|nr:NAD(P)H-dependent oxidoreductase subunit E [Candidatus Woesearchaeota archaeon]
MAELLLDLLKKEEKKSGYISEDAIKRISKKTGMPVSRVYGAATFYHFFHTKPQGRNVIYVCTSPSCMLNNSLNILKILEKELGIKPGEATKDKKFSLYGTSCIGCCDEAPAMLLNGKPYTKLTEEKIKGIIKNANPENDQS